VKNVWVLAAAGFGVALVLGGMLSPFASLHPDGLERVAADKGFAERAEAEPAYDASPLPDYSVPGVKGERMSTALAGAIGTGAAFAVGLGAAFVVRAVGRSRVRRGEGRSTGG